MTLKELIVSMDQNESLRLINSLTGEPLTSITSYNTSINNMNDPKLYIADYYNKEVKYISVEYDSCNESIVSAYLAISVEPITEDKHDFVMSSDLLKCKVVKDICDCVNRHTPIMLVDNATNRPIIEVTTLEESENNPDDKMKSILPFYNCEIVEIFPTIITKTINSEEANNSLRYNTYIVNIVINMEDL